MTERTPAVSLAVYFIILAGSSSGPAAFVWLIFFKKISIRDCKKHNVVHLAVGRWTFITSSCAKTNTNCLLRDSALAWLVMWRPSVSESIGISVMLNFTKDQCLISSVTQAGSYICVVIIVCRCHKSLYVLPFHTVSKPIFLFHPGAFWRLQHQFIIAHRRCSMLRP